MSRYPLDLQDVAYAYLERPNPTVVALLRDLVLLRNPQATVLDVGCGCGANARALRKTWPSARVVGVEPDASAAELARAVCSEVFQGTLEQYLAAGGTSLPPIDAVVLSDVLEHVADPVQWLRNAAALPELRDALWIISVPNYGVWYNRIRTLFGIFDYQWSGLYDRTHLRFYTRKSLRRMLGYCGFSVVAMRSTPSLIQSLAPLLRRRLGKSVEGGDHLVLLSSPSYRFYQRFIEPFEAALCGLWPGLLGFQIVVAAKR